MKPVHTIASQMPIRIDCRDTVPHCDEVLSTEVTPELGMVSKIARYFNNGAVAVMRVCVGSGLVLGRVVLTRRDFDALVGITQSGSGAVSQAFRRALAIHS